MSEMEAENVLPRRYFAIVPAAGISRRMGQPKLLLPWPSQQDSKACVMDCVLHAWTSSQATEVIVVTRDSDAALHEVCKRWEVSLVLASPAPVDMKATVQVALNYLQSQHAATSRDRCLVAPADIPRLNSQVIDRLIQEADRTQPGDLLQPSESIIVPQFGSQRGHPVLFPWSTMQQVFSLAADEGLNAIVNRSETIKVPMPLGLCSSDIDTPEDYQRALQLEAGGETAANE